MSQTKIYVLTEDSFWNYLLKIEMDREIISNLLFESDGSQAMDIKSYLCEYYSLLFNLEELLHEIEDDDSFDKENKNYIITDEQTIKFRVFLEALVILKYKLSYLNCSVSLH